MKKPGWRAPSRSLTSAVSALPPQFTALQALSTLDLSKNDFVLLGEELGALTALSDLNLHWNLIEEVRPRCPALSSSPFLPLLFDCLILFHFEIQPSL